MYINCTGARFTLLHSSSSAREKGEDGTKDVLENVKGLTSRDLLKQSVEELVSDINAKRKRDATMLEGQLVRYIQVRVAICHHREPVLLNNVPLTFTWFNLEMESLYH